jgi:hypothetical protein
VSSKRTRKADGVGRKGKRPSVRKGVRRRSSWVVNSRSFCNFKTRSRLQNMKTTRTRSALVMATYNDLLK